MGSSLSRADLLARLASVVADYGSTAVLAELAIAADAAGVNYLASTLASASRSQPRSRMRRIDDELAAMCDREEAPTRCSCGRVHEPRAFLELEHAAGGEVGDDGFERLAYRNCPCGTTLTRPIMVEAPR